MKFSAAAVLALAGLVSAQLEGIPQCALACLTTAATSAQCAAGDVACLCSPSKYQAIVTAGTPCVLAACGADVAANQVLPAAGRLCAAVAGGGGPSTTTAAAAASARASASSAAQSAANSVASSVVGSVSGRVSSARASASAAVSSRASQVSAAVTSAVGTGGGGGGTRTVAVTNVVTSRNGTAVATSTVTPVSVNGAPVRGPVGLLAVLAAGALAAL